MTRSGHGTYGFAKHHRCGCPPCRAAVRNYGARRYRGQILGTLRPPMDAAPVRAHLESTGLGLVTIARLSGVHINTVRRLMVGERGTQTQRLHPRTADRLLAVRPRLDDLAPTMRVDATGTRRRIQALAAMGWPATEVARRSGVHKKTLHNIYGQVRAETARRVRDTYRLMVQETPPDSKVSRASVTMARRRGWLGPMAWDEGTIDDPKALPDLGGLRGAKRAPGDLAAEIAELRGKGLGTVAIAERLGVHLSTVQKTERRTKRAA